ncbi:hypothetical protein HY025_01590 [Candidatus Daviesbacteria bacterium]|nr:hypothetical protein [Candidatus Daviesbacteria bacterium]
MEARVLFKNNPVLKPAIASLIFLAVESLFIYPVFYGYAWIIFSSILPKSSSPHFSEFIFLIIFLFFIPIAAFVLGIDAVKKYFELKKTNIKLLILTSLSFLLSSLNLLYIAYIFRIFKF